MSGYGSKALCSKGGWVTLNTNLKVNGELPTNDCWRQKTRVPELSCGIFCVILCFAIVVLYQTDGWTHDNG